LQVILRALEQPIKAMGMTSVPMLAMIEQCPVGAETLVARVVHLLTERSRFFSYFRLS
jgi:symplekin